MLPSIGWLITIEPLVGDGVERRLSAKPIARLGNGSYARKLVTAISGGVFGYLDSVLERHSFDEFGELI